MEQLDFFDVPSPCIGVCSTDERGYCRGCLRNRQERFNWLTLTPTEKLRVIRLCRQRYQRKKLAAQRQSSETENPPVNQADPQQNLF